MRLPTTVSDILETARVAPETERVKTLWRQLDTLWGQPDNLEKLPQTLRRLQWILAGLPRELKRLWGFLGIWPIFETARVKTLWRQLDTLWGQPDNL